MQCMTHLKETKQALPPSLQIFFFFSLSPLPSRSLFSPMLFRKRKHSAIKAIPSRVCCE